MLYPDLHEPTTIPKNKLEEDLYKAKAEEGSCVTAYVSKMFAVSRKDLPEMKKIPLSAEMRAKARRARTTKVKGATGADQVNGMAERLADVEISSSQEDDPPATEGSEEKPEEDSEVILGFARLYSGVIRTGSTILGLLPKYNTALEPTHPVNQKYVVSATVEGLYIMMGRELVAVDFVLPGNIFAIKGLEGKVYRSATLCGPGEKGVEGTIAELRDPKSWLVNLGAVNRAVSEPYRLVRCSRLLNRLIGQMPPIVRVALEPAHPADMPKLLTGLKLLSQSDPCVETFQQQTGEYVILTAGELHLEVGKFLG